MWIAEVDDIAVPDLVATLAASMRDEGVVLACCQSRQIDENGDELAPDYVDYVAFVEARDWRAPYVADGRAEIADCLAIMNTIPSLSATLIRRRVLIDVLSDLALSIDRHPSSGDWVVYIEIHRGSIASESRCLAAYRTAFRQRHRPSRSQRSPGRDRGRATGRPPHLQVRVQRCVGDRGPTWRRSVAIWPVVTSMSGHVRTCCRSDNH